MMNRVSVVIVVALMTFLGIASQVSAQVSGAEQSRMELRLSLIHISEPTRPY